MRCLYCGKPLPLLKKLTGGGEFCSDAHRHKYQEEYNKLALSRLLQAQSAPGETGLFPASGGNGLRQLAAPMPPPPMGGQRALPPPSAPALPAGPPALPATAHHQDEKPAHSTSAHEVFRTAAPAPPPPPRPKPAPLPDPNEAPFLIRQHELIGPAHPPSILRSDLDFSVAEAKPQMLQEAPPDLVLIPFEWESVNEAIAASQEPDPPEAPAWRHPIEIHPPVAPQAPNIAAFPFEMFAAKPIHPAQGEVSFALGFPQSVRPKIHVVPESGAFRVAPGQLRLSAVRDWELNLNAPEWRPNFNTISAPPPPPPVIRASKQVKASPPPVATPVMTQERPPQPQEPRGNVEVFIDLSALGIFD